MIDWSSVEPKYRPVKVYGVVDVDGTMVEFHGSHRHWWMLGEDTPRYWEPRFYELVCNFDMPPKTFTCSMGDTLEDAKEKLVKRYKSSIKHYGKPE